MEIIGERRFRDCYLKIDKKQYQAFYRGSARCFQGLHLCLPKNSQKSEFLSIFAEKSQDLMFEVTNNRFKGGIATLSRWQTMKKYSKQNMQKI